MNILILGSKEYPFNSGNDKIKTGGIEVYVEDLAEEFKNSKDIKIILITRKFRNQKKYEKIKNIEIYRVPWIGGFYFRNLSFNLVAFVKALSLDFDVILANGPVASFFALFLSKIKNHQNLLNAIYGKFSSFFIASHNNLHTIKNVKIISVVHGVSTSITQFNYFIKKMFFYLERFVYSKANIVVFASLQEKEQFKIKLKFLPKKSAIIPTGVKIQKQGKNETKKIKEKYKLINKIVLCFVGRLAEVKGVNYLINAIDLLDQNIKNKIKLLIVGDGPDRKKLEELTKQKKLNNIIIFCGQKSRKETLGILQTSNIFVLPSISEGLPIALLEAMASNCACIVTNIGLPIEDKKDGLVVAPKNSSQLKKKIEILVKDKHLREQLGKNALNKAKEKYSWGKAKEKYTKIFNNL